MARKRFEPESPPNTHAPLETCSNPHDATRPAPALSHVVPSSWANKGRATPRSLTDLTSFQHCKTGPIPI